MPGIKSYCISIFILIFFFFSKVILAQEQPVAGNPAEQEIRQKLDSIVVYEVTGFKKSILPISKMEFIYDKEGMVICRNRMDWNKEDSLWLLHDKSTALYDKKGRKIQKNIFFWKDYSIHLEYSIKMDYIYDDAKGKPRTLCFSWDVATDRWIRINNCDSISDDRFDFPLDPEKLNAYPESCPDPETGLFTICKKEERLFNKNQDLKRFEISTRLTPQEKWKKTETTDFKYDNKLEIKPENLIIPEYFPEMVYIYYLNSAIPEQQFKSKITSLNRTVAKPEGKYRETAKFYYSVFPE